MHAFRLSLFALALVVGCAPVRSDDDDATASDDDDTTLDGSCDGVGGVSTLPGVCIRFDAQDGLTSVEQAAEGIEVPYTVIVEAEVDNVVVLPQDAGGCGQPDASGLILFERLEGGGQGYCECDVGLCMGPDETPVTIPAGTRARLFEWTGRNWSGPSDTGNPLGAPFPAGSYILTASAVGRVDGASFTVANTFTITLSE